MSLPPTSTKGSADSTPVTTFQISAPNIPITHSGVVATIGTIPEAGGGTNQTTYTTGDLLYASASNTLSKRAIGSTGNVLTVSGGIPTWAAPVSSLGAIYQTAAGQSISNSTSTIIDFGTLVNDPGTYVTTGGSWHFTVPTGGAGIYEVNSSVYLNASVFDSGESISLSVYVNGTQKFVGYTIAQAPVATPRGMACQLSGAQVVCADADTIDVRIQQNSGGSTALVADAPSNWINITRARSS